jgi:hypothetical protein
MWLKKAEQYFFMGPLDSIPVEVLVQNVLMRLPSHDNKKLIQDPQLRQKISEKYPRYLYRICKTIEVELDFNCHSELTLHDLRLRILQSKNPKRLLCQYANCFEDDEYLRLFEKYLVPYLPTQGHKMLERAVLTRNLKTIRLLLNHPLLNLEGTHSLFLERPARQVM